MFKLISQESLSFLPELQVVSKFEIPQETVKPIVNRDLFFEIDISGSTSFFIRNMSLEFKAVLDTIQNGDTITVIVYDSKAESIFGPLPRLIINKEKEIELLYSIIDKKLRAGGCTNMICPTENILSNNMVENLVDFYHTQGSIRPIIYFKYTDGWHNTGGTERDVVNISERFVTLVKSKGIPVFPYYIGFGGSSNDKLLIELAEKTDGTYFHDDRIEEMMSNILRICTGSMNQFNELDLSSFSGEIFIINNACEVPEITKFVASSENNKFLTLSNSLTIFSSSVKNSCEIVTTIPTPDDIDLLSKVYTNAAIQLRKNKADNVNALMNIIGDLSFIQQTFGLYTQQSYNNLYNNLLRASKNKDMQFVDGIGRVEIAEEGLTLTPISLAQEIASQDGLLAMFPDFYEHIGVQNAYVTTRESGSEFPNQIKDNPVWHPFSIELNSKNTNILIQYNIPGKVEISDEDVAAFGFEKFEPVFTSKEMCLLDSNGVYHMTVNNKPGIFIKGFTEEFFNRMKSLGVFGKNQIFEVDKPYLVDFGRFPLFSKSSREIVSSDYAKLEIHLFWLKTKQTLINYLSDKYVKNVKVQKYGHNLYELLKAKYRISDKGNLVKKQIPISHDDVLSVLQIFAFEIVEQEGKRFVNDAMYPVDKTGKPKNFDDLTVNELYEVLFMCGMLDSYTQPEYTNDLKAKVVKINKSGVKKESTASCNAIKTVKSLIEDIIFDVKLGVKLALKNGHVIENCTTKKALEESFTTIGLDSSSFDLESLVEDSSIMDFLNDSTDPKVTFLKDCLIEFLIETTTCDKEDWLKSVKKDLNFKIDITNAKINDFRNLIRFGFKRFSDQLEEEFKPVEVDYKGFKFIYTPKIQNKVFYCGDAKNLIERANIKMNNF